MANIRTLPPLLQKQAIVELNECPERIPDDIRALREWIAKQPHLKSRTNDQFLVAFLRGCKHSLERAKEKIDKFYSMRQAIPELFLNRQTDDPKILDILKLGVSLRLPMTDGENGPRITIIRIGAYSTEKYNVKEIVKVGSIIGDIQIAEDDNSVISGYVEILDLANVTANHLFQLDMSFFKKLSVYAEEGLPIRQKGVHFINPPPMFETVFNMFRSFMSEKSRNRLFVHGQDMETLYQHVPKKCLPIEYGGENSCIADIIKDWEEKFIQYRDYFIEEEQYGTDESKRIGEPDQSDFGLNGSFRKLDLDY